MAPYDRDSFLAGLAAGRAMWRPRPIGLDIIYSSTQMVSRYEYNNPDTDYYFGKGDGHSSWWGYQANSSVPAGYIVYAQDAANSSGMFVDTVVPAGINRLLIDVDANGRHGAYNTSSISLVDSYGLKGVYLTGEFTGTVLRRCRFTQWGWSAEELNNQAGVTMHTDSQWTLTRQTVEIDISDLHQDLWVGFHRCDCEVHIYSIRAF